MTNTYTEKLIPYIEIVETKNPEILATKVRLFIMGCRERVGFAHRTDEGIRTGYILQLADMLRKLTESWAAYDTPESLRELYKAYIGGSHDNMMRTLASTLHEMDLIEVQGDRFRLKGRR